jgi:hypothetical protein
MMRMSRTSRVFALLLLLLVPLSFFIGVGIAGALIFDVLIAIISGAVLTARWWVDDTGIERRTFLLLRSRLAWADVTWVAASPEQCWLEGRGLKLIIKTSFTEYAFFAEKVLTHVLASRPQGDFTRLSLLEYKLHPEPRWAPYPAMPQDAEPADRRVVQRWRDNPFYVLGLRPECTAAEVERTGQKLLGLLALGVASSRTYATPFGVASRTADAVRAAMAELRDPDRRLLHEVWARLPAGGGETEAREGNPGEGPEAAGWGEAMAVLGWRRL